MLARNVARGQPNLAELGPKSTEVGLGSTNFGPDSGRTRRGLSDDPPTLPRTGPTSGDSSEIWASVDHLWAPRGGRAIVPPTAASTGLPESAHGTTTNHGTTATNGVAASQRAAAAPTLHMGAGARLSPFSSKRDASKPKLVMPTALQGPMLQERTTRAESCRAMSRHAPQKGYPRRPRRATPASDPGERRKTTGTLTPMKRVASHGKHARRSLLFSLHASHAGAKSRSTCLTSPGASPGM